jgi:predicted nucleic acid-binding protein
MRLALAQTTARDLTLGYAALATFVTPPPLSPVILAGPDDDAVLACALAANAHVIISGAQHLLNLDEYGQISILSAAEFLETIPSRR